MEDAPWLSAGPMLNAYPDSLGGTLGEMVRFLRQKPLQGAFASAYLLPSLFHSDLDRGFSVIDYGLEERLATEEDLKALRALGMDLKLDFLVNHASVQCEAFQDILQKGDGSPYRDFFIDWNRFWEGHGTMTAEGYIQPEAALIQDMFLRKPGLPLLMVRFPGGRNVPYWNTFYQEVQVVEGQQKYLGQMDINIRSPLAFEYYEQTLKTLAGYGASIVRLDAFAYAPKAPGKRNFLNEPETWQLLERLQGLAETYALTLLPEIHASYEEKIHEKLGAAGYLCYDFFLPGLMLDAFQRGSGELLCRWAREIREKKLRTVNMLGCHDGIPLLDLKGLLPEERIEALIKTLVSRGGLVKDLHGQKNVYYQVNATYFSALGEDEGKLLLARAIQMFMPGKPQVWYLDLFAGRNDVQAVERAGAGGHKEINRTNLRWEEMAAGLERPVVQRQLELLRFRNTCPAFGFDADFEMIQGEPNTLHWIWRRDGHTAELIADLREGSFEVRSEEGVLPLPL